MSWSETVAEDTDEAREAEPPADRTTEETDQVERTEQHRVHRDGLGCFDAEHTEEDEDIGYDHQHISQRESEHRDEILPQVALSGAVSTYLRYGVLEEDIDSHRHDHNAAADAHKQRILIEPRLHYRVAEIGNGSQQRIGAGDADTRSKSRLARFTERTLNAQHGDGPDGNRRGESHKHTAKNKFVPHISLFDLFCSVFFLRYKMQK